MWTKTTQGRELVSKGKRSRRERDEEEQKRRERLGVRATGIMRTMPDLPRPGDNPLEQRELVARYRAWIEQARRQVGGDTELANCVLERMKDRMGLNDSDPARAAENARDLLAAGIGDAGVSYRAAEVLDRADLDHSAVAGYLIDQYVRVWTELGAEMPVGVEIRGALLVVGERDALRLSVWLADELGTLPIVRTIRESDL